MERKLTDSQLDKLSDLLISIGQVLLASVVIPFFFGIDRIESTVIPSGVVLMLGSWVLSLLVIRKVKK